MCGFLGRIGGAGDLRVGLPWIARRGPDSQRVWLSTDDRVALLHARLAIVDRDSRAHQPLEDRDAGVTVAFVGEIYNYETVKRELSDYPFQTQSDTEVILAAYVRHGAAGLSLLKGMFALAVVDQRRRRVYLVRDAIGKKPLYYARWNDQTLFGSSLLPLAAIHGGPAAIDPEVMAHYWEHGFIPPWRGALRGARPLLPGELLELDWDGRAVGSGRCEPRAERLHAGEAATEAAAHVGVLLRRAVERRLQNNPQPTALLSGGIDSTVVAAAAMDLHAEGACTDPLRVLTLGAMIPFTQDEPYARYAARRLGLSLEILRPQRGRLSDCVLGALDVQDEPLGMISYFLLHRLVEAAARHGRVLLTGDGGDEVFLGYRPPRDWRADAPAGAMEDAPPVRVGPGPAPWMNGWARQVVGGTLLGHMFAKADRASAEQGVEIRCPLLDWDLVSYARGLPFEILAGDGRTKALLKRQLAGWPRRFLERPKLGFAFNLRWRWALTRFDGLRESVDRRAVDAFESGLPAGLRGDPLAWTGGQILRHFGEVWKLLAWSRFLHRLDGAK